MGVMVMDTMAIPIAKAMETMVTGIVIIMGQSMAPIIGDEIKEWGKASIG